MAHLAAMSFFGLRYCLIMDPFVQPQRAVEDNLRTHPEAIGTLGVLYKRSCRELYEEE